ncbi:MAG: TRAP transporter substrate-binding protein [Acetobacteraceae bacterium]|nr:TRAP transporter substrate-binding protein [Acetobacteraceae bacterium]
MIRRQFLATGAALGAAALIRSAHAQATVRLKLGTVDAPTSHSGIGAEAFAKEVATRSNGTMQIDVFHAGSLGAIPDQVKNVFAGAQDLHLLYPEFLSGLIEETKLISAAYLFRSPEHLQAFYKSPLFKPAVDRLASLGGVILDPGWTWIIRDPRGLLSTKPVLTPADLSGMKVRLWEDKTAIETWRGLGGNPVVIPRPQVYLALKQGLIEAGPETIGIAYDQKDVEAAKYWTRTDEYFQIINIMGNDRKLRSLTPEQRQILQDAALAAGAVFSQASERGFTDKKERARLEQAVTIIEPSPGPWREKGKVVLENLKQAGIVPKDLADKAAALA